MKKLVALAIFALASVTFAGEDTPIRNVCDSLSLRDNAEIDIVPAYIDESNWYGSPTTWAEDSTTNKRHDSYKTLNIGANSFKDSIPLSIKTACRQTLGTVYKYATWNNSKQWVEREKDNFATYIYDIHNFKLDGYDSSNTYNLLAFVQDKLPENDAFTANHLLISKTFEFAFEWWYVGFAYEFVFDSIIDGKTYAVTGKRFSSATSNDSLRAYNVARKNLDLTHPGKEIRNPYVRVQTVKVVLSDSRKLPEPESSSSEPPVVSSSSAPPVSSSSVPSGTSSGQNPGTSSSHSIDVSSSSVVGSSSSGTPASSSSQNGGSSSSAAPGTSTSVAGSSSSAGNGSSSSAGGNSAGAETSSSLTDPQSSSSDGKTRLVAVQAENAPARVLQVRSLDGSVVKNSKNLAPGVYYVKNSNGKWQKMAVLPR